MQLEFFGAAGEVTGSCHILTVNRRQILLDCGLIQGGPDDDRRNAEPFPFDAQSIGAVILSHAHIDHSGRLPLLVKRGFDGPIHAQNATCDLCRVLLRDAASMQEADARRRARQRGRESAPTLYDTRHADAAIGRFVGHRYHDWFDVAEGVSVRFLDAGHIMGSTVVELRVVEAGASRRLVFSGDLGQYNTPILRDPESPERADLVVMESTYGGRRHRERRDTVTELAAIVESGHRRQGNILIPAFAIGRSQEILYTLGAHYREWELDRWHIFLDSPMAIEASQVYWDYPHLYDPEAGGLNMPFDSVPELPNLHLTRSSAESKVINQLKQGAIVVAGSGMCNGGRILHHLRHNLERPECQILITGYQARGSLGRRLVDGERQVTIFGDDIQVGAEVHTIGGLSAHGDEEDLGRWYAGFGNRPPVYLVHGEPRAAKRLAKYLHDRYGTAANPAATGQIIDLRDV